ncbi:MAG: hypothetical protein K0Q90_4465 [Paenibacillaceae bacterium]|jgi:signal peptidase|nr:hypothetical protein [Paenibacillaceae bacterium]
MRADTEAIARLIRGNGGLEIPSSGTSMRPLIRKGDRCRFVPLTGAPCLGDILLVAGADGRLVGHRLVRVDGTGEASLYICKGDSNIHADAPVKLNQILGKLTEIRKIRFVVQADGGLARWWGWLLVRWPGLSRVTRFYLRAERRLRRKRSGRAASRESSSAHQLQEAGYNHPPEGKKRGFL